MMPFSVHKSFTLSIISSKIEYWIGQCLTLINSLLFLLKYPAISRPVEGTVSTG